VQRVQGAKRAKKVYHTDAQMKVPEAGSSAKKSEANEMSEDTDEGHCTTYRRADEGDSECVPTFLWNRKGHDRQDDEEKRQHAHKPLDDGLVGCPRRSEPRVLCAERKRSETLEVRETSEALKHLPPNRSVIIILVSVSEILDCDPATYVRDGRGEDERVVRSKYLLDSVQPVVPVGIATQPACHRCAV
jgi:hypothetical protein